ncbi:CrcB family protein [Vreelandella jeotgali]|uniref:CrcB family protein n=1 Tax=Vreelandella jeotgali TaxID=553386 RepID=UPI0003456C02|nr:CrcB family protein [Halomonas jeotgali]
MFSPVTLAGVVAGGALGGALRAYATRAGARHLGAQLPWGTLAANYLAALALGALTAAAALNHTSGLLLAFVATGALGGLSTVSSLAQQTLGLWQEARQAAAAVYLGLSVSGGAALAALGYWLAGGVAG